MSRPEQKSDLAAPSGAKPDDAAATLRAANALARRGDVARAEQIYRTVLDAHPDFDAAHANLAFVLNSMRRFGEAATHFRRALAAQPDAVPVLIGLAHALQRQGRWRDAEPCYRRALALRPDLAGAELGLGMCLLATARLDAARACFERAVHLEPTCVEAWHLLSTLRRFDADDPFIAACEALQPRVAALPALRRARYWFALGKLREDAARYDDAFAAYATGNRTRASLFVLDESGEDRRVQDACAVFNSHPAETRAAVESAVGKTPVFVVGMPRSGTTLVEQILASCPDVHGAGEIADLQAVLRERCGDPEPWAAVRTLPAAALRELGAAYLERVWKRAPQATHIVNKMPSNYRYVGLIRMILPQARIIHVVREPMDSCFSCYTHLFEGDSLPYSYDLRALGRYYRRYVRCVEHWHRVLPGVMLDVRYAELVTDTEAQARRMLDHVGLPWDPGCLQFHRNPRLVVTASRAQVRRPIYRDSVARWRRFESHLQPLLELVGSLR